MTASGREAPDRGDAISRRTAAIVFAVGVTCALHVGKLPVAIPALRSALGLSLVQAGFLLSLVQLAGMLLGLAVGLVADRLGPRRVMLMGLVLLALGSASGALAPSTRLLLMSRVVEGLGFLLAVLPAPGLLRRHVVDPAMLSRALGWWGAYMPLGTALALLLGGALIGTVGWRGAWAVLSMLSLGAAVVLARCVAPDSRKGNPDMGAHSVSWVAQVSTTLSSAGPWWLALAFLLYSGQWLSVIGFLPTIHAQLGHGAAAVGALSAFAAGINMLGNIAAGRLLARGLRPGVLLALGYVVMGLGAVVAFTAGGHPVWQYVAVLAFSGVGGLIPGTLFALVVQLAPSDATVSTTVGWMQQFSALGQFIGPPAVAWVATQSGGWQSTWSVTVTSSVLGLCVAFQLQSVWQRRPRRLAGC